MANTMTHERQKLEVLGVEYVERAIYHSSSQRVAAKQLGVPLQTLTNFKICYKKEFKALQAKREQGLIIDASPFEEESEPEVTEEVKERSYVESLESRIKELEKLLDGVSESSKTALKSVERRLKKREGALEAKTEELKEARALIDKLQQDKKKSEATHFELNIEYQKLGKKLEKAEAAIEKGMKIRLELVDEVKSLKAAKAEAERKAENALKLKDAALQDEIKRLKDKIEGQQVTINSAAKATQAMREAHAKQIAEQEDIHIEDITSYEKDFKALEAEKIKLEERVTELLNRPMELIDARTLPQEQQNEMIEGFRQNSEELKFWQDTAKLYQKQLRELGGI